MIASPEGMHFSDHDFDTPDSIVEEGGKLLRRKNMVQSGAQNAPSTVFVSYPLEVALVGSALSAEPPCRAGCHSNGMQLPALGSKRERFFVIP
jgi:hypothetical protein